MLTIRKPGALDCRPMADLLNQIIEIGGTTALTEPVDGETIQTWMKRDPDRSAWRLAEDSDGQIVGFQWFNPHKDLPEDAVDIGTFVQVGKTGLGIGSALFNATQKAAEEMGLTWINATIRADNEGGLIYYRSRGFRDYDHQHGVALANGMVVDRVLKRFDL